MELSVVMPCLNEAKTVETCVRKALGFFAEHGVDGEVVIADNGSTDGSQQLAREAGARVVPVTDKGQRPDGRHLFFRSKIGDFHCGLRGFRRESILRLGLQTGGMEFASEMVVRCTLVKYDVRGGADHAVA